MANHRHENDIPVDTSNLKPGERIIITRDKQGRVTEIQKVNCWVVTATFGKSSRELVQVRRGCRNRFVYNPLMLPGWCVYKFYGPILAQWAISDPKAADFCKRFLADPIVAATGKQKVRACLAISYLFVLGLLGILLFPIAGILRLPHLMKPSVPSPR